MPKKSIPLVFFGNERLSTGFEPHGAPTLSALIARGYDIKAVVSNFEMARSRKARHLEIEEVATKHNIPVLLPGKLSDIAEELASLHAEVAVLVAYGKIIPQKIIDIFPRGIVNIHPSLLPHYRGSTPIEQAIRDNAKQTGVSLMQLVKEMDAGPVFAQTTVGLSGQETKQALTAKLLQLGSDMLLAKLPAILDGTLQPTPQNEKDATYTTLLSKKDSYLQWRKPAKQLAREIRAFATWPQSRASVTLYDNSTMELIITTAQEVSIALPPGRLQVVGEKLLIGTGDGSLEILRLKVPGKKEISATEFCRGYRI